VQSIMASMSLSTLPSANSAARWEGRRAVRVGCSCA